MKPRDSILRAGIALIFAAPLAARAAVPLGNELQINQVTDGAQQAPRIAFNLADADYVVVWQSDGQDGDANGVFARRYDSTGNSIGSEFQVNTYTPGDQANPVVTGLPDGGFAVLWESLAQDGESFGVFGQRFDASAARAGGEFQVNTYTINSQETPELCSDRSGNVLAVWESRNQDGDNAGIFGQRFDASMNRLGSEFQVNTYTLSLQGAPRIACQQTAAGDRLVMWESLGQEGTFDRGIFAQRLASDGAPIGSEFQVNTYIPYHQSVPDAAIADDGSFVVAWGSNTQDGDSMGVFLRRFDSARVAARQRVAGQHLHRRPPAQPPPRHARRRQLRRRLGELRRGGAPQALGLLRPAVLGHGRAARPRVSGQQLGARLAGGSRRRHEPGGRRLPRRLEQRGAGRQRLRRLRPALLRCPALRPRPAGRLRLLGRQRVAHPQPGLRRSGFALRDQGRQGPPRVEVDALRPAVLRLALRPRRRAGERRRGGSRRVRVRRAGRRPGAGRHRGGAAERYLLPKELLERRRAQVSRPRSQPQRSAQADPRRQQREGLRARPSPAAARTSSGDGFASHRAARHHRRRLHRKRLRRRRQPGDRERRRRRCRSATEP